MSQESTPATPSPETPNRPPYIYPPGAVLMHSPLVLQQANLYGFFVKGKTDCLQRSVDATLSAGSGGRARFRVLTPYVLLSFTRISHAFSERPVDRDKGWIKETDIVTWVIVGREVEEKGQTKIDRVFFYPMHIWVDDTMALINGRELYGYPKYDCQYTMPDVGQPAEKLTLAVKSFQPFSPETQLAWNPLLEVTQTSKAPDTPIGEFVEFMEEGLKVLMSSPGFFSLDEAGVRDVMKQLLSEQLAQIFLKQLPDGTGDRAVYQAITIAPATVNKLHSAALLGGSYSLNLHDNASFPLAQTLGLELGAQDAIMPINLYFDFTVQQAQELYNNSVIEPEKIAILGGGVGSMITAFYLTDQPGWQSKYDISLYQLGWRLGGKGASGRNAKYGQRIEEHGLHIWFGFYENAFNAIQKVYGELGRPPGAPLATWDEAFKPHSFTAVTEFIDGDWKTWPVDFPLLPGTPGDGEEVLNMWDAAVAAYAWIKKILGELQAHSTVQANPRPSGPVPRGLLGNLFNKVVAEVKEEVVERAEDVAIKVLSEFGEDVARLSTRAEALVGSFKAAHLRSDQVQFELAADALEVMRRLVYARVGDLLDTNDELRRLFITLDLGVATLVGMVRDGVFKSQTFDVINDLDLRAWLKKHGANEKYTVDSAPVRALYDLVFAYVDGDFSKPNVEAGTMLRATLRIGLLYKGGVMWKMQAGMGDVIFAPMYEVLKKRGVKFHFFHKVEDMVPKNGAVDEILMTQQVALKGDDYNPFVTVKGLDCWPSEPNYGEIDDKQAALLQANGINLESMWTNWPEVYQQSFGQPLPQITLKRGVDFDRVVFGISIGSLPWIAPKLLAESPALASTSNVVKTVATQAYQLWLNQPLKNLGWAYTPKSGEEPVLSGFTEPYDTWASMDQLLCREDWPAGADEPKNCAYFCSAFTQGKLPPPSNHGFPAEVAAVAKTGALNNMTSEMGWLWPAAAGVGKPGKFEWGWLVDPDGGSGEARFNSQYWRANVDPSEQYVLSVVNSTKARLETNGSGFSNLYLTGDWIRTGLNAGCVEAATMAGMQTSRAMTGYPAVIQGEKDFG
ncbi:MAG: NAD(P)-binding protein [Moraxellaceae bacterium]|nr:NAD(P)-binding protein [Moraxellaceae bacterium]